jgi:phage gp36-like protein
MSYATPADFAQRYGADEAVQVLSDSAGVLTAELLLAAIAVDAGTGDWPDGTPDSSKDIAVLALQRVTEQLSVASNYMDGYLRSACALPLSGTDANLGTLKDCCLALTRSGLANDAAGATERTDQVADRWRSWLRDVANGRVQLVGTTGEAVSPSSKVKTGQAASSYSWGSL